MPTYEYKREDGTTFEVQQSINDDALRKCPTTGQKVKRVISGGGGVVYKGSGWYVTDYKDSDRKKKRAEAAEQKNGKSEDQASSKSSAESSGKTESDTADTSNSDKSASK